MTYSDYPRTDKQAVTYAEMMTQEKGVRYYPICQPKGVSPYGITHAAVTQDELIDYLQNGWSLVTAAKAENWPE